MAIEGFSEEMIFEQRPEQKSKAFGYPGQVLFRSRIQHVQRPQGRSELVCSRDRKASAARIV